MEEQYQGETILLEGEYREDKTLVEATLETKTAELKKEYDADRESGSHRFGISSLTTLNRPASNKFEGIAMVLRKFNWTTEGGLILKATVQHSFQCVWHSFGNR